MTNKQTIAVLGTLALLAASCNDDDSISKLEPYRYKAVVSDRDNFEVQLPDLSGVASIGENPWWFNAAATPGNDKSVTISVTRKQGEDYRKDSVLVNGVAGDRAWVVVEQAGIKSPDYDDNAAISAEYKRFLTDWENVDTLIYKGEEIQLPWAGTSSSTLPQGVIPVKKEDGWEMAFSAFHSCNTPYFGVYNKYMGILRIFYFNSYLVQNGSEWVFKTQVMSSNPMVSHLFYNSMLYGIPANHRGVENKRHYDTSYRLNGASMLTQAVNPYGGDGQEPRVEMGWVAFDVDMGHYDPNMYVTGRDFFQSLDALKVMNQSNNLTQTTLFGNLVSQSKGNLDGNMAISTTNANGLNAYGAWNNISSGAGKFFGGIASGNYLDALVGGGSALYNGYMVLTGQKQDHYESKGTFEGSLTMETAGTVDVKGFDLSANGSLHSLSVRLAEEAKTTGSHLGQGVWSLQQDPVIYVANDYITGAEDRFNLIAKDEKNTYNSADSPRDLRLQLITFPDPSTLKVNISPVFKDVKNINVSWTWGVYTGANYSMGHSRAFRESVLDQKMPQLVLSKKHANGYVFGVYSGGDGVMYYEPTNSPEGQVHTISDNKYHVWGKKLTSNTVYGEQFIATPCLLLPFTEQGGYKVYDPELQDLVVCVVLSFDFRDDSGQYQRAVLSKRFLPKVQAISLAEMKKKRNDSNIKKYMAPDAKVDGVGYPTAAEAMKSSLYILDQL